MAKEKFLYYFGWSLLVILTIAEIMDTLDLLVFHKIPSALFLFTLPIYIFFMLLFYFVLIKPNK